MIAASLAASSEGFAQSAAPAPDVLQLTDGSMLRGRMLELRLYQTATIRLEDGSNRVVPWSQIWSGSADVGGLQSATNQRSAPWSEGSPSGFAPSGWLEDPLEPRRGTVPLRIESDGAPQHIGMRASALDGEVSAVVCTTPCTLYVRPGMVPFFALGDDGHENSYNVTAMSGGARVLLHAGSPARRTIGIAMIPLGAVGMLAGMMLSATPAPPSVAGMDAGGLLAIGSIAMLIGGVVLLRQGRPGLRSVAPLDVAAMGLAF